MGETEYVVVGGGTAGCVVAARLAGRGHSVTLLEAGGRYSRILDVPLPGLWAWMRRADRYAWDHETVPQAGLGGRRVAFPSGRLLGGSSAINAMIYCPGPRASYDRWGVPGWSHAELRPWLDAAEDSPFEGRVGVSASRFEHPLGKAFLAGCASLGIPSNPGFRDLSGEGAGFYRLSQRGGRRSTSAAAGRIPGAPSLRLVSGATVLRVRVEGGRAVGVEYLRDGQGAEVRASREVVLCAGTVKSPQILQLSGIGPAEALHRLGIPVVAESAGVGAGLQDHVRVPVLYAVDRPRYDTLPRLLAAGVHYAAARRGLLASNVADVAAIVRSRPDAEVPDLRVVLLWRALRERRGHFVAFEAGLIDPRSRGRVGLASADPLAAPRIDPGYFAEAEDRVRMREAIALARRIAGSAACREAGITEEVAPGSGSLEAHVRTHATTSYHPVGTCRMGADADAVVDPALRVVGVAGLRVVDASVMPSTVSGNAQAAVLAIAEQAAERLAAAP